jgi:CHAT domain-containing protein
MRPLLSDAQAQLASLYDLLLRPLIRGVALDTMLVVSPDGPLHYVPFHALYDGERYVVERHPISTTPSATVMDLCARHTTAGEGMLVMGFAGSRLHAITAEIDSIGDLFPGACLVDEPQSTADRFLAEAPQHRILHLAAHAHFRTDNVMLSFLSLADRRLTLAEIARLRLDAELATLSACETGRGQLHGADLISLASSFLGAGTRSLLVSLWRVDDETAAWFMRTWYQALREGNGRAEALRRTQRALLDRGRTRPLEYGVYRHPAYWASFCLIGEWGRLSGLPEGGGDGDDRNA